MNKRARVSANGTAAFVLGTEDGEGLASQSTFSFWRATIDNRTVLHRATPARDGKWHRDATPHSSLARKEPMGSPWRSNRFFQTIGIHRFGHADDAIAGLNNCQTVRPESQHSTEKAKKLAKRAPGREFTRPKKSLQTGIYFIDP